MEELSSESAATEMPAKSDFMANRYQFNAASGPSKIRGYLPTYMAKLKL
jgi:hypothetical protein